MRKHPLNRKNRLISAVDLVKNSYELYKKNAQLFLIYVILVFIPSAAVSLLGRVIASVFNLQTYSLLAILYAIVFFVLGIVAYFLSLWFSIAFIKVIAAKYEGKAAQKTQDEIASTKQFIIPAVIASLLAGLAILGGFILLIIPGIIFSVWFAFALYAVVLDGQKDIGALRFSKKLVKGRWWGTLWRFILPALIYIVLSGILQAPFSYLANSSNSVIISYIALIMVSLVSIVLTPFVASAQTILYLELKKTKTKNIVPPSAGKTPIEPPV